MVRLEDSKSLGHFAKPFLIEHYMMEQVRLDEFMLVQFSFGTMNCHETKRHLTHCHLTQNA